MKSLLLLIWFSQQSYEKHIIFSTLTNEGPEGRDIVGLPNEGQSQDWKPGLSDSKA